jgi:hypothetical protein
VLQPLEETSGWFGAVTLAGAATADSVSQCFDFAKTPLLLVSSGRHVTKCVVVRAIRRSGTARLPAALVNPLVDYYECASDGIGPRARQKLRCQILHVHPLRGLALFALI